MKTSRGSFQSTISWNFTQISPLSNWLICMSWKVLENTTVIAQRHWAMQQQYIPRSLLTRTPELFVAFLHNWTRDLFRIEEEVIAWLRALSGKKNNVKSKNQTNYSLVFAQNTLQRWINIQSFTGTQHGWQELWSNPSDVLQPRSWPTGPSWSQRP